MKAITRCYDFAGIRIGITDTAEVIENAIDKAFSLSQIDSSTHHVSLKGTVRRKNSYFQSLPTFIRSRIENNKKIKSPLMISGDNGELGIFAQDNRSSSYACCYPPFNHIELCCKKQTHKKGPLLFQSVLIPMLSELFLLEGRLLMHAGCVAVTEGHGILFPADSGGGKTTTVLSLVRAGFQYISDDLVVVSPNRDGFDIEPIYEKMNLTSDTLRFFPELTALDKSPENKANTKIAVKPTDLFNSNQIRNTAQFNTIIILTIKEGGPKLLARKGHLVLNPLMKSNSFAFRESISKKHIDIIWSLLDRSRSYELITGLDPIAMGEWLAKASEMKNLRQPCHSIGHKDHF